MPDSDALTAARQRVLDWGPDLLRPSAMVRFRQDVRELERLASDTVYGVDRSVEERKPDDRYAIRAETPRTFEVEFAHATTRLANALRADARRNRAGRDWTLAELAKVADRTLLHIRNFGTAALAEVRSWETVIDRAAATCPEDDGLPADTIIARYSDGSVWTPEQVGEALSAIVTAAEERPI